MRIGNIIERCENLPVGVIATALGAVTLSTPYHLIGFPLVRHIFSLIGIVVLILATIKITLHHKTFVKEYGNVVPASLYGAYTMLMMSMGAYAFTYFPHLGKALWLVGIGLHAILIVVFTYRNVIKNFNINSFVPSWFVTYNGIMVSTVVGGAMNEPQLSKIILYYGIAVFFIIIPFMIRRLIMVPVPELVIHTKTVLIAPIGLCLISYLNVIKDPNKYVVFGFYGMMFLALVYVLLHIPKFFSYDFHPGFAGTTFPMAVGVVGSFKMSEYLAKIGDINLSLIVKDISGLQMYITTVIIGFVFYNFLKKMFID
ncbi:MAG: TDT family transporter [Cetobacterium sp.]